MNYHILSTAQRYIILIEGATCDDVDIIPNAGDIQSSLQKIYGHAQYYTSLYNALSLFICTYNIYIMWF